VCRADQIRRTLSLASLDHLLVLSANQGGERERLLAEVQRAGKDLVWRDAKEKRLYPKDAERTLVLATKRGLREYLTSLRLERHQALHVLSAKPASSTSTCKLMTQDPSCCHFPSEQASTSSSRSFARSGSASYGST
jgi:hypothetical protein